MTRKQFTQMTAEQRRAWLLRPVQINVVGQAKTWAGAQSSDFDIRKLPNARRWKRTPGPATLDNTNYYE